MRVSLSFQNNQSQGLLVEFIRIALYLIILIAGVVSSFFQSGFLNWDLIGPFYGIICVALGIHIVWVSTWEKLTHHPNWLFAGFALDALFISALIYFSGFNQSLFLFLHLVNILLAGMACQSVGALGVAFFTSIFFTLAAIFSPEMKALQFLFLLVLNNIAFFAVAGLSGYLSEQLQTVGRELKKTGQNLRSAQELNKVIIENIPSGMLSFADSGEIIQANDSAAAILEQDGLLEKNWYTLFPDFKDKKSFKGDVKFVSKPEAPAKILGLTVSRIFSADLQENISIALMDDLTQIRELENRARQNEKLAAVGGLAAGIAHEIRNPLAGISGSIEMLSQTATTDDDKKLMKIVLREIDRLNNLITEFLDYARPETPPTDPVNVSSLLSEVLDSMKVNSQVRADIVQVREYTENLVILGKRDKLKQAFLNIIINSYQAMNEAPTPSVRVMSASTDKEIVIRIKDSGCGMSETTLKRMFEPFHTTKPKGTGLGLAVTHKILEGHGAKVIVESEPGKGTEFILSFPKVNLA